jgi:hypothetical protein
MSVSTRTVQQQSLGIGQLGAALVVLAVAILIAVAIAFGSLGATKTDVTPAAAPPVVIDHGWSQAYTSTGNAAPPAAIDHGSSESSMGAGTTVGDGNSGSNGPRLRPQ